MIRELHEIEPAALREGGDLVKRGFGVAALFGVDVKITSIKARLLLQRVAGLVRRALGLRGQRWGVAEVNLDLIEGFRVCDLRLADVNLPFSRRDRARQITT